MSHDTNPNYLTSSQAATRLECTAMTVHNLVNRGELPAFRMGRRIRIKSTDLENYIKSNTLNVVGA